MVEAGRRDELEPGVVAALDVPVPPAPLPRIRWPPV